MCVCVFLDRRLSFGSISYLVLWTLRLAGALGQSPRSVAGQVRGQNSGHVRTPPVALEMTCAPFSFSFSFFFCTFFKEKTTTTATTTTTTTTKKRERAARVGLFAHSAAVQGLSTPAQRSRTDCRRKSKKEALVKLKCLLASVYRLLTEFC